MESMDDQSNSSSTPMAVDSNESTNKETNSGEMAANVSSNVKPVGQPLVEFLSQLEDYTPTVRLIHCFVNLFNCLIIRFRMR